MVGRPIIRSTAKVGDIEVKVSFSACRMSSSASQFIILFLSMCVKRSALERLCMLFRSSGFDGR